MLTWVIGYEQVTQRTHVVCSRVSAGVSGNSCKDMVCSLEPCFGCTVLISCLFLHLPGGRKLTERAQLYWMNCSGVRAAVACKLSSQPKISVTATKASLWSREGSPQLCLSGHCQAKSIQAG